ncbi:CMRF35-like molecule 5 [Colossoma macropomum]|uniref:CMRF35-like molecule 5 n=1 Tax=Colossoma macropomum TaxID=42526 RepID=UPI001864529F|nr:CMRF35-like molecule 5 [Colossoma macropomum]XP_036434618.1 CMRF35-like molecule 5 [Colossoma macropomum]XP_036434619.1 CMRF35-like molecule 5 [Colossoma macropomum]
MKTLQRTVLFFQVLICVEMKNQSGNVFTGTEGGRVEIYCNYPDGYQYVSQYFCRHPCSHSDVLIKTEKADKVTSEGRYSILNTVSAQSLSVTIRNLRLGDSGVYYCGVDKWGKDRLSKVVVTVRKVSPNSTTPASTHETAKSTEQASSNTVTQISTVNSTTYGSSTKQSSQSSVMFEFPIYGGVLGLLLCCVLVALVVLYRRRSNTHSTTLKPPAPENQFSDPPLNQEEVYHIYDEMLAVYSLAGPADKENSSETYSVIQHVPPTEEDSCLYSLIAPH